MDLYKMDFQQIKLLFSQRKKYLFGLIFLILSLVILFISLGLLKTRQDTRSKADQGNGTNVIVFMVDDLDSASFYQLVNNNKLPNIKYYLIDKGATFNNSFVTESICCSSRATFLTGMYSHNTGVYNVVGAEGGEKNFHQYNNNLPIWLQSLGYHTGMIGKYMNLDIGAHGSGIRPGWDYWRHIRGYDSRPGSYSVITNDSSVLYPDYYQTKYMAETVEQFLNQYPQNFFLYITPHSPHINLPAWNANSPLNFTAEITSLSGQFLAFNEYKQSLNGTLKRSVLKKVIASSLYRTYESNLQSGGDWSAWNLINESAQPFPGTGDGAIISHNLFYFPDNPSGYREQLIRGTGATQQIFYRDNTPTTQGTWINLGNTSSVFTGTGSLPIVSFSITQLETSNILQSLLRGSRALGYQLYTRARLSGTWTGWTLEPDSWEANSSYGDIATLSTNQLDPGIIRLDLIRKNNDETSYAPFFQNRRSFYADFSANNNILGVSTPKPKTSSKPKTSPKPKIGNTPITASFDEGQMFGENSNNSGETNNLHRPTPAETDVHPYWSGRVYAEGNWPNYKTYQGFGGTLPAGSLRQNNDPNGFTPISASFNLPSQNLASFNNQASNCTNKNPWLCANWTNLTQPVVGGRPLQAYVQRQHLDRLESLLSVDALVGDVLSLLASRGSLENTLVIFTSDNGMFLGEFTLGNKMLPYENSLRVPLIIKPPQSLPTPKINNNTVVNLDLAPTILDYVGANWSSSTYNVDGRSAKPLIQASAPLVSDWRKWFLVEYRYPRAVAGQDTPHSSISNPLWQWAWVIPDLVAIRSGLEIPQNLGGSSLYFNYTRDPLGLADRSPFAELYDLAADPIQVNNLYNNATDAVNPAYAAIFQTLTSTINNLLSCSGPTCRQADQAPTPPSPSPSPSPSSSPSPSPSPFLNYIHAFEQTSRMEAGGNRLKQTFVSADGHNLYVRFYNDATATWENTYLNILVADLGIAGISQTWDFSQYLNPANLPTQSILAPSGNTLYVRVFQNGAWGSWSPVTLASLNIGRIISFEQMAPTADRNDHVQTFVGLTGETYYYRTYNSGTQTWNNLNPVAVSSLGIPSVTRIRNFEESLNPNNRLKQVVTSWDGTTLYARFLQNGSWSSPWITINVAGVHIPGQNTPLMSLE
ncbi:MAG: sulfatase-like hydrolase/transferase [Patescibacteria group bacterium]|nr:sulfatase-like hydrolase/transferase [Patescibacteria group bacterium]